MQHHILQACARQWRGDELMQAADWWLGAGTYEEVQQINEFLAFKEFTETNDEIRQTWAYKGPLMNPELMKMVFFTDAFSLEPEVDNRPVIYNSGAVPVATSNIANANIGTLPHAHTYITCHGQHGTMHWHPAHGLRHGPEKNLHHLESERKAAEMAAAKAAAGEKPDKKRQPKADKFDTGKMFHGCETWLDHQPAEVLAEIKGLNYLNFEEAFVKYNRAREDGAPTLQEVMQMHPFSYLFFLVRAQSGCC